MKKTVYVIFMISIALYITACGKNDISVEETENTIIDSKYPPADEAVVKEALSIFSTGIYMEEYHEYDNGDYYVVRLDYVPNYLNVDFDYNKKYDREKEPFLRFEKQGSRVRVMVKDSNNESILLESEGMIENVNPEKLINMLETLMNYENIENKGIENINNNMYWVEEISSKDTVVQFFVCMDRDKHSMIKYGDSYLPVTSFEPAREVVLDGEYESSLDIINQTIKENVPEDILQEWIQWLNN